MTAHGESAGLPPRPLVLGDALARRLAGSPALVLLDVDGTLAPIAPRPEDAVVPPETLAAVAALVAAPATHVALVSGRAASDALRMVRVDGLWALGNHGFETVTPAGEATADPRVAPHEAALREVAAALTALAGTIPEARLEDKRLTLSLHTRRVDAAHVPVLRAAARREAEARGFRLTEGKEILELRPPVEVHKGTASVALARRLGALAPGASLFFAGDDVTDEDAFAALREAAPHAVTVRVGEVPPGGTRAEFVAPTLEEVRGLLAWMGDVRRGTASSGPPAAR